jgi:poly-beta-1,6-N-acetyl-D-glucosamine N-deacetylase
VGVARDLLGSALGGALARLGEVAYELSRARAANTVTSIYFHQPTAPTFRGCIVSLLRLGFNPITSQQLDDAIYDNKSLPELPLHVSFDDAWRSNLTEVVPTIEEFDIPVTIFVPTEPIESGQFWWTQVENLTGDSGRTVERLKKVPDHERRRFLENNCNKAPCMRREAMTLEELRRIGTLRQVTIGSHTVNHPILPNCDDVTINEEVRRSREVLEGWLDQPVTTFAYPNGDFDQRVVAALQRHGYRSAFSTHQARAFLRTDAAFMLPRFALPNKASSLESVSRASGAWSNLFHRGHRRSIG